MFQGEQKRMRRLLVLGQRKENSVPYVKEDKTAKKEAYRAAARALLG